MWASLEGIGDMSDFTKAGNFLKNRISVNISMVVLQHTITYLVA